MTIAFYVDSVPFGPEEIAGRASLGGSESACLGLARALHARGHRVHIFATQLQPACQGPDAWGVLWHDAAELVPMSRLFEWDVFCALRMPAVFSLGIKARLRLLWNQDLLLDEASKHQIMGIAWALDQVVFVSDFHRTQWKDWLPELDPIAWVTKNGYDPSLVPTAQKQADRIIHVSRPERGLLPLLEMWPAVRAARPSGTLQICRYSSMYDTGPGSWSDVCAEMDRRVQQVNQAVGGIEYLGELGKADLYQAIANAAVMWYPGVPTFAETSCLAAVESQACGTPFVGSFKGALPETVPSGILIPGDAFSPAYQQQSVRAVLDILEDAHDQTFAYRRLVAAGRQHAEAYQFDVIATEWEAHIEQSFRTRYKANMIGVLRNLLHYDDHTAADRVAYEIVCHGITRLRKSGVITEPPGSDFDHNVLMADPEIKEAWKAQALCQRVIAGQDQTAEQYAAHALDPMTELRHPGNGRLQLVAPAFAGCTHVLDVACGNGAFALAIAEADPTVRVTGIDYAEANIAAAREAAETLGLSDRVTFICAPVWDFEAEAFSAEWAAFAAEGRRFDGLWCGEFVEHVSDCTALIDGLEAVCRPGARVRMTVPSGPMVEYAARQQPWHRGHVHHFCHDDLTAVFGPKGAAFEYLAWSHPTPCGNGAGHWSISYETSDVPAGRRDYAHRIVSTRPKGSLSVGILTHNSEHDILRCLDAIWPVADEILIGDTGSQDTTKALVDGIRKVRVIDLPTVQDHPDGFSGARNALLAQATGEWFAWIDPDEVLIGTHALQKYLDAVVYQGFAIYQNHLAIDLPTHADSPVRIFRRRPEIAFYGCVHEQPQWGDCNGDVVPSLQVNDVQIAHTGYLVESVRRQKMAVRNLPLLEKDRQRFPDRVLGSVLVLRDLVNLADYHAEAAGHYTPKCLDYLTRAVGLFESVFRDPSHKHHALARPWYERALQGLAIGYEVELALGCKPGGLKGARPRPRRVWVREPTDLGPIVAWHVDAIQKQLTPPVIRVDPVTVETREAVPA